MAPKAAKKTTNAKGGDKPKTKRAPSPYIIFCSEKRPELRAAHPNATFGEMGKMLGQMWAQMDEKAKAVSINIVLPCSISSLIDVSVCMIIELCQ